jgi:hypothetical protein
MTFVKEDTEVAKTAPNPLGAYINATMRDRQAVEQHTAFFNSDSHIERVAQVCDILEEFFERSVDYITARGLNRNLAFDNVKMQNVGAQLSKVSRKIKWDYLYGPLYALNDVDVLSTNGHLMVRVYPVGKMPKKRSKHSVYRWYDVD